MDLTDRLAAVAALYEAHRNAPFPSRWRGADVAGFDMIMLDSYPSGCISVWLAQVGVLDNWRWNILAEYEQQLLRVVPELNDYGREYYQRLLDMAELVLEADSPPSSA
ncbi:hypothetical protein [Micromonospora chersina]|uniref:hypothetical protein n=1 Tax=Micromonospora chersina TaxID=47854 RepID=UPI003724301C